MVKSTILGFCLALAFSGVGKLSFEAGQASKLIIPDYLSAVYEEYEKDQQFQMMLSDYGAEYAIDFLENVYATNRVGTRGGGGNVCYQYVTNVQQTKTYNCGSTTVLQSLYGMGAAGNVPGSTDAAKISTIDTAYNVDSQGSLYVYQVADALNTYKPSGYSSYVYSTGASKTEAQFEQAIATSLTNCKPVVLHAKTGALGYYGGHNLGHYLSLDYVDRTTDMVRIVDCNYNNSYYGVHSVTLSEAYSTVSVSGRYFIY
jgi:hypothetical protein